MQERRNHSPAPTKDHARPAGQRFKRSAVALAVALAVGGLTGIAAARLPEATHLPDSSPLVTAASAVQSKAGFAEVVHAVQPAVVNVAVVGTAASTRRNPPDLQLPDNSPFREFFERFFEQSPMLPQRGGPGTKTQGVGSGFIVTPDGYIVTNHHVIDGAEQVNVVLNDGRRLTAELRGVDPKTDLALLKVETDDVLPYVTFGDSDTARAGDWVLAIGNPFGLGGSVTSGIISARGRDIQSGPYDDYLQIDAPINRGNSGGPLFDLTGQVIGVNTAIYSPTGGNVGIGFAVPAAQAKPVIEQLMAKGHVERGWLGVQIQTVTDDLAKSLGLPRAEGALVGEVTPDSPAARAGIRVGDVILSFNKQQISELKDLPRLVADTDPGAKTPLSVWRDGKRKDLHAIIERTPGAKVTLAGSTHEASNQARLGLAVAPITPELRERFKIGGDVRGTLVVKVESGSAAERRGLKPGDVIMQAGRTPVAAPADLATVVQEAAAADQKNVLLLVNRQGEQWFVAVAVG